MIKKISKLVPLLFIIFLVTSTFDSINESQVSAEAPDDFEQMRSQWFNKLTGGKDLDLADPDIQAKIEAINEEATDYWTSMDTDPETERLWEDLDVPESAHNYPFNMQASYTRLKQMALAYSIKGSELYHDERLLDDIIMGMEWVYTEKYNENTNQIGNWWQWQIGLPLLLNDLVVLLYDELTETQKTNYMNTIDHFVPDPTRRGNGNLEETGANRVDKALAVALRGVIGKNPDKIAQGRDALSKVFLYSTGGDGFYKDGSFIQHGNVAYTGSYGYVLIDHLVDALYLLGNSSWEVTDPNLENVYKWVKESYEPLVYNGLMMDMVRGRAISREIQQDNIVGSDLAAIFLRLSQIAPPEKADYINSMVKSWIEENDRLNYEGMELGDILAVNTLLNDSSVEPKPDLTLHKQFPAMDRIIHRRPGFAFGISMSSERIRNYETGNDENLRAWYTGQGMTYLYNGDLAQFNDNFWPNVDHYRLPGTTSDGQTRQGETTDQSWAGGASMDDLYGVAGMKLDPDLETTSGQASSLSGQKSWFMFDDEIVALGAGITSESGSQVETIVENRKINEEGDNTLTVNGEAKPSHLGWSETMENVDWAHLEGNTKNSDIGYFFPDGSNVIGKRESSTHAWSFINELPEYATYTPSTRNFLSLAIEHGIDPVDDNYSYVLLPNKNVDETEQYQNDPDIQILSNTNRIQAVKETQLDLTAANFFESGPNQINFIRSYDPASVIINEEGDELTVSVSDPTKEQEKITLELGKTSFSVLSKDDNIDVLTMQPYTKIEIDVSGSLGESHTVKLSYNQKEGELPSRADALKTFVEQFAEEGAFANTEAPHALMLHLTAVSHYEDQEAAEKVVKHMEEGFKDLLDYQKENELISNEAFNSLQIQADELIAAWQ
ncbi:hyaluronate lyase [Virgibacillus dakarensis]|uniref:polysaccharide lyase 8 family protein n=1 Tax=Virgibacillus dakarensis TaxID=1917889 RepID=UPI000B4546BA|nr:polysaccharide lyase 8 family protein [Virgibacillus dakarensis]MTW84381.1 hyaluronate lyase [Virgibacillus dakarensis]